MKIKKIKHIGKKKVYDISVADAEHYVLKNGVITHNTGIYYSASSIFILGRQQEKDAEGVSGYNFIINVEKSRYSREKSKIPVQVLHDSGINRYSGLLDIALELGFAQKPSNGWYSRVDDDGVVEDKKWRAKDTFSSEFWKPLLDSKGFKAAIEKKFKIANSSMMTDEDIDAAMDAMEELEA